MKHLVIKTFGRDQGFSCVFRHWRGELGENTHLHGYTMYFEFVFVSEMKGTDIGNVEFIDTYLHEAFDHTVAVTLDDPQFEQFDAMEDAGICSLRIMEDVGLYAFAEMVYKDIAPITTEISEGKVSLEAVNIIGHDYNVVSFERVR